MEADLNEATNATDTDPDHALEIPESKALEFRVDMTVTGADVDAVNVALLYENRLKWDPNVVHPGYINLYDERDGMVIDGACARAHKRWV